MEVVTLDDLIQHRAVNQASVAFLSTLFEMLGYFSVDGEQILARHCGYRNRKWVETLFEIAADEGYFRKPGACIERALPYAVIQPLITDELIADFCLADDLLRSLYYERRIYDYQQQFMSAPKVPHAVRRCFKDLRTARLAFCRLKATYLRIAYRGRVSRKVYADYDVAHCTKEFVGGISLNVIFSILPAIAELYPRDTAADAEPISNMCHKYARLLAFCDEAIASLSD